MDRNPSPGAVSQPTASKEDAKAVDYLIFIGGNFYESAQDFIDEASAMGISRRMPSHRLPSGLVVGKSRIYMAHGGSKVDNRTCVVFGYFVPQRIEYIATHTKFDVEVSAGVRPSNGHTVIDCVDGEGERGCGKRRPGGTYLVVDKSESPLVLCKRGAGYNGRHFRGLRSLTGAETASLDLGHTIGELHETSCDVCGAQLFCAKDGIERQQREARREARTGERKWLNKCPNCKKPSRPSKVEGSEPQT